MWAPWHLSSGAHVLGLAHHVLCRRHLPHLTLVAWVLTIATHHLMRGRSGHVHLARVGASAGHLTLTLHAVTLW